jgi:hypothetical protein
MKLQDEIINRVCNLSEDQQRQLLNILKTWQTGKQRAYQRLKIQSDVNVLIDDKVIKTNTLDISASGIYIDASGAIDTDKSVRVVFSIPGRDKPYKLDGTVVRVDENGMAIKFESVTPYFKEILDSAIWKNVGPEEGGHSKEP